MNCYFMVFFVLVFFSKTLFSAETPRSDASSLPKNGKAMHEKLKDIHLARKNELLRMKKNHQMLKLVHFNRQKRVHQNLRDMVESTIQNQEATIEDFIKIIKHYNVFAQDLITLIDLRDLIIDDLDLIIDDLLDELYDSVEVVVNEPSALSNICTVVTSLASLLIGCFASVMIYPHSWEN